MNKRFKQISRKTERRADRYTETKTGKTKMDTGKAVERQKPALHSNASVCRECIHVHVCVLSLSFEIFILVPFITFIFAIHRPAPVAKRLANFYAKNPSKSSKLRYCLYFL